MLSRGFHLKLNTNLIVILTKYVQQCCGYFLPCNAHAKSSSLNSKQSPMVSIHSTIENVEIISNEELNLWRYNYRVTHSHDPIENHNEGWCVLDQMDWNKKGQKKTVWPHNCTALFISSNSFQKDEFSLWIWTLSKAEMRK